jgi:hypothetical protein
MVRESELATMKLHQPVNVCAHGKDPEQCGPCELHSMTKACLAATVVADVVTLLLVIVCLAMHGRP